jgi:hypothetical protein
MMCDGKRDEEGENEKIFRFTAGEEGESSQQYGYLRRPGLWDSPR